MSNSPRKVELSCLGRKGSHVRGDNFSYKYFRSPARDGKAQILSNIIIIITIIILMKLAYDNGNNHHHHHYYNRTLSSV